jgi:hypothetical protein
MYMICSRFAICSFALGQKRCSEMPAKMHKWRHSYSVAPIPDCKCKRGSRTAQRPTPRPTSRWSARRASRFISSIRSKARLWVRVRIRTSRRPPIAQKPHRPPIALAHLAPRPRRANLERIRPPCGLNLRTAPTRMYGRGLSFCGCARRPSNQTPALIGHADSHQPRRLANLPPGRAGHPSAARPGKEKPRRSGVKSKGGNAHDRQRKRNKSGPAANLQIGNHVAIAARCDFRATVRASDIVNAA